jgi:ABC-type Fe3+/spermidine/putrescine transport system ATPase subunit
MSGPVRTDTAVRAVQSSGQAAEGAIELEGIEIRTDGRAGGRTLLGPLDMRIERGEHLLLCGPSGSGKTTLLRAIAGLARPARGNLTWFGRRASEGPRVLLPPHERRVGFLFQGGALWPHLSARRTIEFCLRARKVPRGDWPGEVERVLGLVELRGFAERMPSSLSSGEAQRLALARALAQRPAVLLLDEPLGPLDQELRGALLQRLGQLHAELGLTTVHVTHDPQEAACLASRTMNLRAGRIVP